jgi:cytochrome c551/c552
MKAKHPGFKKVAASIASKQGISKERASAILAAGARKAGKAAVKANPRLKKVSGVVKRKSK